MYPRTSAACRPDGAHPHGVGHDLHRHHRTSSAGPPAVRGPAAGVARWPDRPGGHPDAAARSMVGESRSAGCAEHRPPLPAAVPGGRTPARRRGGHPGGGPAAGHRPPGRGRPARGAVRLAPRLGTDRHGRCRPGGDRAERGARRRRHPGCPRQRRVHGARHHPHQAMGTSSRGGPHRLRRVAAHRGRTVPAAPHVPGGGDAARHRPGRGPRLPLDGPGRRTPLVRRVVPRHHHAARHLGRRSRPALATGRRDSRRRRARPDLRPGPTPGVRARARRDRCGAAPAPTRRR